MTKPKSTRAKIALLLLTMIISLLTASCSFTFAPANDNIDHAAHQDLVMDNRYDANNEDVPVSSDDTILQLYEQQDTGTWVSGSGTVTRLLADDTQGDAHQRFLLELANGHSLIIVHNIDIAPRLEGLAVGDTVRFHGEYYYNEQGGGIHWTHHDPSGRKDGGYLEWNGEVYE